MAKLPPSHQIRTVNWNATPGVILESVLNLYQAGQLDAVVKENSSLHRIVDAMVTNGDLTRDKRGRFTPTAQMSRAQS